MKKSILLTALALASTDALACHQPPKRFYPQPEQSTTHYCHNAECPPAQK